MIFIIPAFFFNFTQLYYFSIIKVSYFSSIYPIAINFSFDCSQYRIHIASMHFRH